MKGRTFSAEHKQHLSDARQGRFYTDETRQKMSTTRGGPSLCGQKVTRERYDEVMATKPDVCDCCGNPQAGHHALGLDHDKVTGALRGWLCHKCNMAIGGLGDNAPGLERALEYLQKTPL